MSQSVIDTKAEPSEFHQIVNDPDKRLQWIYEHLGTQAYQEAKALRESNERARQKLRMMGEPS